MTGTLDLRPPAEAKEPPLDFPVDRADEQTDANEAWIGTLDADQAQAALDRLRATPGPPVGGTHEQMVRRHVRFAKEWGLLRRIGWLRREAARAEANRQRTRRAAGGRPASAAEAETDARIRADIARITAGIDDMTAGEALAEAARIHALLAPGTLGLEETVDLHIRGRAAEARARAAVDTYEARIQAQESAGAEPRTR